MDTGVVNNRRFIDVTKLYEKLGTQLANALPGFHVMTGYDLNPSIYRKAKIRPSAISEKS